MQYVCCHGCQFHNHNQQRAYLTRNNILCDCFVILSAWFSSVCSGFDCHCACENVRLDEKCHFNRWCDWCISKSHIDCILHFCESVCMLIGRYVIPRRMHLFELTTKTRMTINFPIVLLWDFQFSHEKRTRSGRGDTIICNWAHSAPLFLSSLSLAEAVTLLFQVFHLPPVHLFSYLSLAVFFSATQKKLWLFYLIVIQIIVSGHIVRLRMHNLSRCMIVSHLRSKVICVRLPLAQKHVYARTLKLSFVVLHKDILVFGKRGKEASESELGPLLW